MLLLQLRQFFFSLGYISLLRCSVLLGRHVIQYNDITLLKVESIQMIKCILRLWKEVKTLSGDHAHAALHPWRPRKQRKQCLWFLAHSLFATDVCFHIVRTIRTGRPPWSDSSDSWQKEPCWHPEEAWPVRCNRMRLVIISRRKCLQQVWRTWWESLRFVWQYL